MMGEADVQAPMWSYRVNLDKRVRSDHPLRRINAVLDLGFVRGQVAHTYGRRGNKSVPPEVILRMMLLLFLDDIKSERELMRIIPRKIDRRFRTYDFPFLPNSIFRLRYYFCNGSRQVKSFVGHVRVCR